MRILYGLGRLAFGGFFLYNGINHLTNPEPLEQYAAAKKQPEPHLSVVGSGWLLTAAGASLMLCLKPRLGAIGVAAFLAGVSPVIHDFWNQDDPGARQGDMIHFTKNMALLAAAVALLGAEGEHR